MSFLFPAVAILAAYLIGSISFAIVFARLLGLPDPRSYGSGNPGATNVLRSGSKKAAALTLLFDALKGYVPTAVAMALADSGSWGFETVAGVALAAFVGHLYPVYFQFRGGKGVATAAGILFGLSPWLAAATLATWLVVALVSRYSSLAALAAAVATPIYYWVGGRWPHAPALAALLCMVSLLLIWRHRRNIRQLIAGTEPRFGSSRK